MPLRHRRRVGPVGVVAVLVPSLLSAQTLAHRSRVELRFGVGSRIEAGTTVLPGSVVTESRAAGLIGAVGYTRWFDEATALTLALTVFATDAETRTDATGVRTRSASVVSFLVGGRLHFPRSSFDSPWRPFGSIEVGPVFGSESATRVGAGVHVDASSHLAFAARGALGVDRLLGNRWSISLGGGYTAMSRFDEPVGGERDHSGPDVGLGVGWRFGGG